MLKKKKIGILVTQQQHPNHNKGKIIGIEEPYLKLFSQYGTVVPIMPNMTPDDIDIDVLVLPGGPDLDPSFIDSGEDLIVGNSSANPMYSQFYKNSFQVWRDEEVPMMCICLGFQAVNVMLGGTLTPDGPYHSLNYHALHPVAAYSEKLGINSNVGTRRPLRRMVNSRHHQFIRNHQLAEGLLPVAFGVMSDTKLTNDSDAHRLWGGAKKGGPTLLKHFYDGKFSLINPNLTHIEAYVHTQERICGVQWHPEDLHLRPDDFLRGDYITHKMMTWLLEKPSPTAPTGARPVPTKALETIV